MTFSLSSVSHRKVSKTTCFSWTLLPNVAKIKLLASRLLCSSLWMPAFILPMVKLYDAIGKWLHLKTFRSKFVSKYFSHQDLLELVKSSFREVCNLTDLTAKPLPLSLLVNCLRKLRNIKQQLYSSVHPLLSGSMIV